MSDAQDSKEEMPTTRQKAHGKAHVRKFEDTGGVKTDIEIELDLPDRHTISIQLTGNDHGYIQSTLPDFQVSGSNGCLVKPTGTGYSFSILD